MKRSLSPLRYPGGKASIYDMTRDVIASHDMELCQYAEPYAGGCGLALRLLTNNIVDELHLNDIDQSIASLWSCIVDQPEELSKLISLTKIDMDEWYKQKAIQDIKDTADPLELAFSTLFLNRTNRSGIIKAGVIGGKKQDGAYRMDCRFNKAALIKKVHQIAAIKDKIHIYNMDAIKFIEKLESITLPKPLLMVDPPYYNKGQSLYTNFYNHEDHAAISEKLAKTDLPWLLTYDNTPEISDLYKEFAQYQFDINYSAAKKRIGSELFITSPHFDILEHERLKLA
jgi:DNA adenine methylase